MSDEVGHGEEQHQNEKRDLEGLEAHDGADVAVVGVRLGSSLLV